MGVGRGGQRRVGLNLRNAADEQNWDMHINHNDNSKIGNKEKMNVE